MSITKELSKPLDASEIDFRVQSINKGGYATILAYKNARVDIKRLNSVLGVEGWQRKHEFLEGRQYCSIGIRTDPSHDWCWVQDVGTKSSAEAEKGESSDSFKRAAFNLGIGIELYDYPQIQVKLKQDEYKEEHGKVKQTWKLKLKEWMWTNSFDDDGKMKHLSAHDGNAERYMWGVGGFSDYDKALHQMSVLRDCLSVVAAIKDHLEFQRWSSAKEEWDSLTEDEQRALWVAQTKGGVFTTIEREQIKSTDFREAQ